VSARRVSSGNRGRGWNCLPPEGSGSERNCQNARVEWLALVNEFRNAIIESV